MTILTDLMKHRMLRIYLALITMFKSVAADVYADEEQRAGERNFWFVVILVVVVVVLVVIALIGFKFMCRNRNREH